MQHDQKCCFNCYLKIAVIRDREKDCGIPISKVDAIPVQNSHAKKVVISELS